MFAVVDEAREDVAEAAQCVDEFGRDLRRARITLGGDDHLRLGERLRDQPRRSLTRGFLVVFGVACRHAFLTGLSCPGP